MERGQEPDPQYSLDSSEFDSIGWKRQWEALLLRERRCFVWLAHLAYGKDATMSEAEIELAKRQWQEHKDRLLAKPLKRTDDIDPLYLQAVSVDNPTSLAWVTKMDLEIAEIRFEEKLKGMGRRDFGKFFGVSRVRAIRAMMCYSKPAFCYFGEAACTPCRKRFANKTNKKSWALYFETRPSPTSTLPTLRLPCGLPTNGKRDARGNYAPDTTTNDCFTCTNRQCDMPL